jgi:hypothetical protein
MEKVNLVIDKPIQVVDKGTSSTELRRNAKGIVEITVKVYNESPKEAANRAISILNGLQKKFPYPKG